VLSNSLLSQESLIFFEMEICDQMEVLSKFLNIVVLCKLRGLSARLEKSLLIKEGMEGKP